MASSPAMAEKKKAQWYVPFVSGAVAGGCVKTFTAPLSRSTILLQTAATDGSVLRSSNVSSFSRQSVEYLKSVGSREGVLSFWKGNGISIVQKMATTGSNYYVYERIKNFLRPLWHDERDVGFGTRLLAGSLAGATNVTLTYPLDLCRTNISSRSATNEWAGLGRTLSELYAAHGIGFLRRGLLCTQLCQGLNIGLHFGIYETANTYYHRLSGDDSNGGRGRSSLVSSLICGSIAGLVASTIVQPLDLIRRRQQIRGAAVADRWFFVVGLEIVRESGIRGLYRGIVPELCKVCLFPASGVNFYIYELVRQNVFGCKDGVR